MSRYCRFLIFAFLVIFPLTLLAQSTDFEKFFKDTDVLYSVQQTSDTGYILSGLVSEEGDYYVKLIKTDLNGDSVWSKKYPSIAEIDLYKTEAIQTSDGGYIMTGTIEASDNMDVFLIKTDATGETSWQQTYGGPEDEKSWSIEQTNDHGYLISTNTESQYFYLIKVDSLGTIEWEKQFGPILSIDRRSQAIQTSDSYYAVIVKSNLSKIDQNGDSLWARTYDYNFRFIQEDENKNLILAGRNILMKTDSLGNALWIKEGLSINPNILTLSDDGGAVLAVDQIVKLDDEGREQWRIDVDGTIYSLKQLTSGGSVFCGENAITRCGWMVKTRQTGYYQSLILISPHDGDRIHYGANFLIEWHSRNVELITINFSEDNGVHWQELISSYPADSSAYRWFVPFLNSTTCKIRLTAVERPELSVENEQPFTITYSNYEFIAINQIKMWFSNDGNGAHDPFTGGPGLFWPGGATAYQGAVFEDGLVYAGIINGDYYAGGNSHRQGLQPGNILDDGSAANPDSSIFQVWKIRKDWGVYPPGAERDRLEHDYHNWPVELGAPWIDHDGNGIYDPAIDQPKLYGDETNWMVMNDLDTTKTQIFGSCDPIGLEIQCTIYGYDRQDVLEDVVFKRYEVINKGQNYVDQMAFGYWSDVDLGFSGDDYVGCDTLLDLGYCYNATNSDGIYGSPPPAVGYLILKGPHVIAGLGNSVRFNNARLLEYMNLGMSSFMGFT